MTHVRNILRAAVFIACLASLLHAAAPATDGSRAEISLSPGPFRDLKLVRQADGVLGITLEGNAPHFWTAVVPAGYDPARHTVFALEYFAPAGLESVTLRYREPSGGMAVAETKAAPLAESWQPLAFDLGGLEVKPAAGHPEMRFHLALHGRPGAQFQLRRLHVRAATAEEKRLAVGREQRQAERAADATALLAELRAAYPASLATVQVGLKEITVTGTATTRAQLVGIPPELPSHRAAKASVVAEIQPDASGNFRVNVPRLAEGSERDRALWRWRLRDAQGRWLSLARWPTAYEPTVARKLPRLTAPHQKGLGGIPSVTAGHEIFDLGIRHATLNVVLHALIRDTPAAGWTPWPFEGRTYFLNESRLRAHDTTLRHLAAREVIVSAILLVGNGRQPDGTPHTAMTHPEAEARGTYSIPNLTAEAPAQLYRAALHLMAERWSRADGAHGRVANWIMHNEVDQAATWTNMGAQPVARYLETYLRSARLMHHTARLFDPHARVFISLTHHWAKQSSGSGTYIVREMLELFAEMARAEGDFEWGVAYHPYPQNLRNPDAWNDRDPTDTFDTPYITPKNIAVLPRFLDQPRFHFAGQPRGILLSEQGFNTPTLSEADQRRQAAGLIYVFRQIRPLKAIEAYHLHRYQDMPAGEGGLRLGIITETGAHKLGWEVYRALGTPREAEFAPLADEVMARPQSK
ncbi:MAG: hypothetical protein B9S33_14680 [Pedosphaera sp. Tous-C6FEB]|nr:MAG: hypothetical protein B9S33_14680 [Pedosphaera sp. Tous-C6FEB]